MLTYIEPEYIVDVNNDKCTRCKLCVKECAFEVHSYDDTKKQIISDSSKCVNCRRCVVRCPKLAIRINKNDIYFNNNSNWTEKTIREIQKQSQVEGILLGSMGKPNPGVIYWDRILLNASQVTNPPIDPLREPMELNTFLGKKPNKIEINQKNELAKEIPYQLELKLPILFSAMSFGAISLNACESLLKAASSVGTYYNIGEGGLHQDLNKFRGNTIVQVASGRFGVNAEYLKNAAAIEIKIGQGAKPGIGGHLPGYKVGKEVASVRMIPEGSDAISPAPHHDIYSIEDLKQLIYVLKETTSYKKPIIVKVAAVHNIAAIASGIVRAGADAIAIDGYLGGTGAAPVRIRDNVGIPIEFAIAAVDERLKDEGIRNDVSIIASGSIRNSSDIVKAIALGADAVYIGTAALIALGCHICAKCYTGKCNWGIATQNPELTKRLNPQEGAKALENLLTAWEREIKEIIGGMGINSLDSLRGNRHMLRGIGLSERELDILGIELIGE